MINLNWAGRNNTDIYYYPYESGYNNLHKENYLNAVFYRESQINILDAERRQGKIVY